MNAEIVNGVVIAFTCVCCGKRFECYEKQSALIEACEKRFGKRYSLEELQCLCSVCEDRGEFILLGQ